MDFSSALRTLRDDGSRVRRAGWNGKGMWLVLMDFGPEKVSMLAAMADAADQDRALAGLVAAPWIGMKTADGTFVPWLASQTDLLADDWELAEDNPEYKMTAYGRRPDGSLGEMTPEEYAAAMQRDLP